MRHDWSFWARDNQLPPDGDWRIWLLLAGRGFGKTRTGAEWVRMLVTNNLAGRIALIGPTAADTRDVVANGESGILSVFPPSERPHYSPSNRRIEFRNGAIATTYSAEEPDRLRGPQHDAAWVDELAAFRHMQEAWDMLMFGLRLGNNPRCCVTTTPRPVPIVRDLLGREGNEVAVTRGSTFDNEDNLAAPFLSDILRKYEGTRLGRQEIFAEILDDTEGALWTRAMVDASQVADAPPMTRVVVAIDPAITAGEKSDETGIVVVGLGTDGRGYVIDDLSGRYTPGEWAARAVDAFDEHKADRVVAEGNQGGEMVTHTLRSVGGERIPVKIVHASRGKQARAEPVAALYEQGRVGHVGGLAKLEDQLCTWVPGAASPDRLDALVWGITELMLASKAAPKVKPVNFGGGASRWRV